MKKQIFIHLSTFYIDDLVIKIQTEIESRNNIQMSLVDIQYSGLTGNDGLAHAYLVFEDMNDQ